MAHFYIRGIFLAVLVFQMKASKIELTSSPTSVTPPLTPDLTLRCGLKDDPLDTSGAKETPNSMLHVMSIIVTRGKNNDYVARVTQLSAAQAFVDTDRLTVKGRVKGDSGDEAFLELKWKEPDQNQTNIYNCEINAMDDHGHSVRFHDNVTVDYSRPRVEELAQYLAAFKKDVTQNYAQLRMRKDPEMLKMSHSERGVGQCGDSSTWTPLPGHWGFKRRCVHVTFDRPYDEVPVVSVGLAGLDNTRGRNTRLNVWLRDVTKTGFRVDCETWADTRLMSVMFQWISVVP